MLRLVVLPLLQNFFFFFKLLLVFTIFYIKEKVKMPLYPLPKLGGPY